jgi:hypothetical protein
MADIMDLEDLLDSDDDADALPTYDQYPRTEELECM